MKKCKMFFGACLVAASSFGIDLPWVYDSSERTVVDVKSVAIATHAGVFASMLGHWSYASDASSIQTTKWQGLHFIVR